MVSKGFLILLADCNFSNKKSRGKKWRRRRPLWER